MVHCCVPGCTNHSAKTKTSQTTISYHKIPSNPESRKVWIARLGRENLPPLENCFVCSAHFTSDCFERNLFEELTGQKRKRKLKSEAVPSIFSFSTTKKARTSTENRLKRQQQRETLNYLLASTCTSTSAHDDETVTEAVPEAVPDSNAEKQTIDIGVQCSFDAHFVVTRSVETQTEEIPTSNELSCLSQEESIHNLAQNVLLDHTYCKRPEASSPAAIVELSPQKSVCSLKSPPSSIISSDSESEDEYEMSESSTDTDSDAETRNDSEKTNTQNYVNMNKYLVFDSCLNELFKFCLKCGAPVSDMSYGQTGSLLTVKTTCLAHHDVTWNSQPTINNTPVGNLLICSSILFTGNTFARLQNFASCLGLQFLSASVFYKHQDQYLFPVVNDAWQRESSQVIERLSNKAIVKMNGDGRCDSPGHNAKYGTYTLMDSESGDVAVFNVVQVTEVSSSNAMEKEGFVRCVDTLEEEEVVINTITTDRHVSITSAMEKEYSHIDHQYDVWHLAKSVVKKLNKKAKKKECEDLKYWIQSISNHLWWSAATCNGDPVLLKEKWVSIVNHVQNKHSWRGSTKFKKCAHPRLSRSEAKKKCWLKPGTAAFTALEDVVLQPRLVKDLQKLTGFCHTGGLEVYHSMLLKYCPKRQHFSYKGMVARTQLAAIDNNCNTGRDQAVIKTGARKGEARFNQCFPKVHKRWVVKPVKERKKYDFLEKLQVQVLDLCDGTGEVAEPLVEVELPANIASEEAPDKHQLIQQHRSRFSK